MLYVHYEFLINDFCQVSFVGKCRMRVSKDQVSLTVMTTDLSVGK